MPVPASGCGTNVPPASKPVPSPESGAQAAAIMKLDIKTEPAKRRIEHSLL